MRAPTIVHEAESHRHHVRVKIPAKASVGGTLYGLKDLSASGVAIEGYDKPVQKGARLPITLVISFNSFSFSVNLDTHVAYYNPGAKLLGCRFDALNREQVSILNLIIKSYLSGVLITQGDLLNTITRDNFVQSRRQIEVRHKNHGEIWRRRIMFLLLMGVGCVALFFITGNIYEKFTLLKSYDASVVNANTLEAMIPSRAAHKLDLQDKAVIKIAGEKSALAGSVERIRTAFDDPSVTVVTVYTPDAIPDTLSGRPAYVEFYLH